jgi:tetratricopeptide (TPR) repeat protein
MEERTMSNPQSLDQIGPMQAQPQGQPQQNDNTPKDPIQIEFEEGKRFLDNGSLGQAAVAFHNVLLAYEEKQDENGVANACNQLGLVCLAKEDFDGAEKNFQRAWEIVEKNDDPMSMLVLNLQFVKVHRGKKDYSKALNVCFDLLEDYQNNNNQQGAVYVLEEIAQIFLAQDKKESAVDAYKTIASIHKNFSHTRMAEEYLQKAADLEA